MADSSTSGTAPIAPAIPVKPTAPHGESTPSNMLARFSAASARITDEDNNGTTSIPGKKKRKAAASKEDGKEGGGNDRDAGTASTPRKKKCKAAAFEEDGNEGGADTASTLQNKKRKAAVRSGGLGKRKTTNYKYKPLTKMKDMFQQLSALTPRDDKFDPKDPSIISQFP